MSISKKNTQKPHYFGHRARLREKFLNGLGSGMADYELLELILFNAIPRKDVKPLAKELIKKFSTLPQVINAEKHQLIEIQEVTEKVAFEFELIKYFAKRLSKSIIETRPVLDNIENVISYLTLAMGYKKREELRIIYLDKQNRIIANEILQEGTVDHAPVYPREILKQALNLGASAMIMVHNHPSGDATPSKADINMTINLLTIAETLNIKLHDHIIITKNEHVSFKNLGLL